MNRYMYNVLVNGAYECSGSLVECQKTKKAISRKHDNYNVIVKKTTLKKFKSCYK